ncbi:hypothetical protein [Cellulomonas humilata]|uniref:Uncharacterized protein n=1 Tax=Cellulomonas humilata TaxID=144055 RepID=A0ABU0EL77_9CELL|nr:hypothetical protein [Cellulomonas humilata]MDQ0375962.1 hypothetical protein [Cellulomonas humilata]
MAGLILSELGRWVRALVGPCVALAALAGLAVGSIGSLAVAPELHIAAVRAWQTADVLTALWLVWCVWRTGRRPVLDRRAASHLQDLRDRADVAGWSLVCVVELRESSPAGQHIVATDVRTGVAEGIWLSEVCALVGSYALIHRHTAGLDLVDVLPPTEMLAARRDEAVRARRLRRAWTVSVRRQHRRQRRAARAVARATEGMFRRRGRDRAAS